ncbi:hypothetical protein [Agromyces sp. LHK192]|uniref:hypothetical protein n=1 Tax=Agromyces sp. LHK192 TaxID=2498704 RepID=UPI000FDBF848|nr:hypothetical protein [Agromyces sp. LHK192]
MPISSARVRISLILIVAAVAALVIGVLAVLPPEVDRVIAMLPPVPVSGALAAQVFAVVCATGLVIAGIRRLAGRGAARGRRRALESANPTADVSTGVRHSAMRAALVELGARVHLPARFSVVADERGLSLWTGGRRPRRVHEIHWREVRAIRSDSTVAGSTVVPVALLRIRRDGSSLEVPVILAGERASSFALTDAPFFATVRSWKAKHRAALAAEGLELPPLTAPIPVITADMLAGAVR